jgi:hypothetical protein
MKKIYSDYLEIMVIEKVELKNGEYRWHEADLMYYHTEDEEQPAYDYEEMQEQIIKMITDLKIELVKLEALEKGYEEYGIGLLSPEFKKSYEEAQLKIKQIKIQLLILEGK